MVYPTAGVLEVPLLRIGSTALNSYVRVVVTNLTVAKIPAIPGVHFT